MVVTDNEEGTRQSMKIRFTDEASEGKETGSHSQRKKHLTVSEFNEEENLNNTGGKGRKRRNEKTHCEYNLRSREQVYR